MLSPLTGSTGCGKTTIVPLLLFLQHKNARLLIALPRRIATQMAAERLRQLLGDQRLGKRKPEVLADSTTTAPLVQNEQMVGSAQGHHKVCIGFR